MLQFEQRQLQLATATLVVALLVVSGAVPSAAKQVKPSAIFVFGDSYADTGNRIDKNSSSWRYPYGITWGSGTGRFSNGRVFTDYLVELIGLPPLEAYASITDTTPPQKLTQGVNFAIGGAGVFPVFGIPTIFEQVGQFQGVLSKRPHLFSLEKSVAVLTYNGNDYFGLQIVTPNATDADFLALGAKVVPAIGQNVENLYLAGFRKFLIANLAPAGCLPFNTGPNATQCDPSRAPLVDYHNSLLSAVITNLRTSHPDASFLELDLFKAFNYVIDNPRWFGIQRPLGACCAPLPTSPNTDPLYSVCPDPQHSLFWDTVHPTDAGWKALVNLFYSGFNFTGQWPNLLLWLHSLHLGSSNKSPETYERAAVDLVNSLGPDYPHLLPKLSSTGALSYLPTSLSEVGPVTVFLSSEAAIEQQLGAEFWQTWPAVATEVALEQVVYGWWPADRLGKLRNGYSLRTLGGNKVQLVKEDGKIFLTAREDGTGRVAVVQPTFFVAKGVVLVHKTDALLLPAALSLPV